MRSALLAVSLAIVVGACAPTAQPSPIEAASLPGNPAAGLRYAQAACASCHAIAAGVTWSPDPAAPSFETIANTPGMTRVALSAWLHSPHPSMPHLIVEPDRIDDLAAYLMTLERAGR